MTGVHLGIFLSILAVVVVIVAEAAAKAGLF